MTPKELDQVDALRRHLEQALFTKQSVLVGCSRQNIMREDAVEQTWRFMRGNALLHLVSTKLLVTTPIDEFHIYYTPAFPGNKIDILHFRGGKTKGWWQLDFEMTAALVETYTNMKVAGSLLLREVDGELHVEYFQYRGNGGSIQQATQAIEQFKTKPSRINKSSGRASVLCKFCPVKAACDSLDLTDNDTQDWPKGYAVG
uniref:PD-(D/E)XK nuclease superfamily protein n=1 Tax=viral metagenome TaxID=1070528 RepID=A0A6M3JNL4_9ZZZZ